MALQGHDLAILTARFGTARFGASRFGFIPCPEDVRGVTNDEPGEYVWKEQIVPSQEVETDWTLQQENCTCRDLCTIEIDTPTPTGSVTEDVEFDLEFTLSGIRGTLDGVININWGDGGHDETIVRPLLNTTYTYSHTYLTSGDKDVEVRVIDENGCRVIGTATITVGAIDPLGGSFEAVSSGPLDPGEGLLTLTPTITGGSGNYSYAWSAWSEWGGSEIAPAFTDTDEIGLWSPLFTHSSGNGICSGEAKLIVTDTSTLLTLELGPTAWTWWCV